MEIATTEIRLDAIEVPFRIFQDPLINLPGREDYLYALLHHRLSFERWPCRCFFLHEEIEQLEPSSPSDLQTMDRTWLFANPDRVLYYAWDLLKDDGQGRETLFRNYSEEISPDDKQAEMPFNLLQQRFDELKKTLAKIC